MKPALRDTEAQPSVKHWASPAAPWVVSWWCMVAPGTQRACTLGFSGYHQVVAVEKVGVCVCVWGGVCDFSLSVCVSVRKSEREHGGEQEIVKVLCEARMPGEMFCAVGVFLRMSSTCFGAVGWCVKCTPPGRQLGRCDVGPLCRMCVAVWVDIG